MIFGLLIEIIVNMDRRVNSPLDFVGDGKQCFLDCIARSGC